MDASTWRRAKELLAATLTLPTADRDSFLARECADPGLRREIDELLKHADEVTGLNVLLSDGDSHQPPLEAGARIGPYLIAGPLGVGGMGEVYRARDPRLGRDVALKIICGASAPVPAAIRRFTREAQTASSLSHPNIVSVFDVGESEWGPFIVMEIVEGRTLRGLMKPTPTFETAIHIGRQIARALGAAHAAGIVHRDIKPENVMVRDDGQVKVLDFGICRVVPRHAPADAETTTRSDRPSGGRAESTGGRVLGTVAYMSPEQARGEPADAATDIFALGVLFYELFAGRHPFAAADEVGRLARLFSEVPPPPSQFAPELPSSLDGLITRMLEKEARARPTAGDIDEVLAELLG